MPFSSAGLWADSLTDDKGNSQKLTVFTVTDPANGNAAVTLYMDATKASVRSAPYYTTAEGNAIVWATPGFYTLTVPSTGRSIPIQCDVAAADINLTTDASVMHLDRTETVTGPKNFTGGLSKSGVAVATTADVAAAGSGSSGAALAKANNLSDLPSAVTARTNLGLGTAATQPATAFDASGAAATAQTAAQAYADSALATALAGLAPAEYPAGTQGSSLTHSGIGQTINSVVITNNMRVLDTANSASAGLWVAKSGAWTRPVDFATGSNAQGKLVEVAGGGLWLCVSTSAVTVDTTTQVWTEIDASIILAGSGLSKTGNTIALAIPRTATPDSSYVGPYIDPTQPSTGIVAGTVAGTYAAGDDSRIVGALQAATAGSTYQAKVIVNPKDSQFGAKADRNSVSDGAITASSATFTSATAGFSSADVGKTIKVVGAGASGADLNTTISACTSATQVTLAANASTTVSAASTWWASDDTIALQLAINYCNALVQGGQQYAGIVQCPAGIYNVGQLYLNSRVYLVGVTRNGQGYRESPVRFLPSPSIPDDGYMINQVSGNIRNLGIIGISSYGQGSSSKTGFINLPNVNDLTLTGVYTDNYGIEACIINGGNCRVSYSQFAGMANKTYIASQRASFTLTGTDHQVSHCEFTGPGNTTVSSSNLYCAAASFATYDSEFDHNVYQVGDIGMVITGGARYRFAGCRWDSNAAHGMLLSSGSYFNFDASCSWSRNSYSGDGLYDHINVPNGGGSLATFTSPMFTNNGHTVRYNVNDAKSSGTFFNVYLYVHGDSGLTGNYTVGTSIVVSYGTNMDRQIYTYTGSTQSWSKPSWAGSTALITMLLIGGGSGGGSGRRGADGTVRSGGSGGGGSGWVQADFSSADIPSSLNIFIGAGGAGGAAVTTDDTNGSAGTSGGTTIVSGTNFYLRAFNGGAGAAGTATSASGGGGISQQAGGASGGGSSSTGAAGTAGSTSGNGASGAGGGGGITTANVTSAGGAGGASLSHSGAAGAAGVADGGAGGAGNGSPQALLGGTGGGGGGSSRTTAGGTGGAGGNYGAPGGGGGASLNGFNSGAGGAGAPGLVLIITK